MTIYLHARLIVSLLGFGVRQDLTNFSRQLVKRMITIKSRYNETAGNNG